jgi:hypothetical protein
VWLSTTVVCSRTFSSLDVVTRTLWSLRLCYLLELFDHLDYAILGALSCIHLRKGTLVSL